MEECEPDGITLTLESGHLLVCNVGVELAVKPFDLRIPFLWTQLGVTGKVAVGQHVSWVEADFILPVFRGESLALDFAPQPFAGPDERHLEGHVLTCLLLDTGALVPRSKPSVHTLDLPQRNVLQGLTRVQGLVERQSSPSRLFRLTLLRVELVEHNQGLAKVHVLIGARALGLLDRTLVSPQDVDPLLGETVAG